MALYTFSCLDGHTCGNPVRLVSGGAPLLKGATMSERRLDFLANHDWIRKALMFELRCSPEVRTTTSMWGSSGR